MLLHPKLTKKLIILLQISLICSVTVVCFLFVLYLTSEKNQVQEFFVENLSKNEKDRMTDLTTRLVSNSKTNNDGSARLYDPQVDNYENPESHDEATMDTIYIDDYAQEYQKYGNPSERSRYDTSRSEETEDSGTIIRNFNAQNDNVALLENIENIDKIEYFDRIIVDHDTNNAASNNNNNNRESSLDQEEMVSLPTKPNGSKKGKGKRKQKQKVKPGFDRYLTDNESDDELGFSGSGDGAGDDLDAFDDIDSYTVRKSKNWHRRLNRLNRKKQAKLDIGRTHNRFRIDNKEKSYYKTFTSVEDDDEREAHVGQVFKQRMAKQHRKLPPLGTKSINTNVVVPVDSWVKSTTTTTPTPSSPSSVAPQLTLLASTLKTDSIFETRARRIKSNVEKSEEKARKLLLCEESGNYGELCRMLFKGDISN